MSILARSKAHARRVAAGAPKLNYDQTVATLGPMWYSTFRSTAVTWPSWATVKAGDYAASPYDTSWFTSWYREAGLAPANYDTGATSSSFITGAMWYSPLKQLDP